MKAFGRWFGAIGCILWIYVWTKVSLNPPALPGEYRSGEDMLGLLVASIFILVICQIIWITAERSILNKAATIVMYFIPGSILLMGIGRFMQIFGGEPQPLVAIGWILTSLSMIVSSFLIGKQYVLWMRILIFISGISFLLISDLDWRSWLALPYGIFWFIIFIVNTQKKALKHEHSITQ